MKTSLQKTMNQDCLSYQTGLRLLWACHVMKYGFVGNGVGRGEGWVGYEGSTRILEPPWRDSIQSIKLEDIPD